MVQWFGVGVEIQCYSIYQGQSLVKEDHLESRQNDDLLGLSDVCQLWTVQTLLKLWWGGAGRKPVVEAHYKFPLDTQEIEIDQPA